MKWFIIPVLMLLNATTQTYASDIGKEKRWADQVLMALMDGEEVWLDTPDGHSFLNLYTESEEESKRAAIIIHGTGIHPDWQQVIQPLRVGLTRHGWNTLSMQMPVLANGIEHEEYAPLFDDVPARIDAAVANLRSNGIEKIVIIGHSLGATMASYHLSKKSEGIDGLVIIGMSTNNPDPRMDGKRSLSKITIPTFDLYGSDDLADVLDSIDGRKAAAEKAGNTGFSQREIKGANHFFDGKDDELIESVADWLNRTVPSGS